MAPQIENKKENTRREFKYVPYHIMLHLKMLVKAFETLKRARSCPLNSQVEPRTVGEIVFCVTDVCSIITQQNVVHRTNLVPMLVSKLLFQSSFTQNLTDNYAKNGGSCRGGLTFM